MTSSDAESGHSDSVEAAVGERAVFIQEMLSNAMVAYQGGSLDAFEPVYEHLLPRLLRYLRSLTLDKAYADDLVQEAFLQLHRSRHTYVPPRPVEPWAFGIARHVFLMDRRSGVRRARDRHESLSEQLPVPSAWERWAQRATLQQALAEIPDIGREPLLLHHLWGFSFAEIGHLLGLRPGTVKVRAHRALQRLRAMVGETP